MMITCAHGSAGGVFQASNESSARHAVAAVAGAAGRRQPAPAAAAHCFHLLRAISDRYQHGFGGGCHGGDVPAAASRRHRASGEFAAGQEAPGSDAASWPGGTLDHCHTAIRRRAQSLGSIGTEGRRYCGASVAVPPRAPLPLAAAVGSSVELLLLKLPHLNPFMAVTAQFKNNRQTNAARGGEKKMVWNMRGSTSSRQKW